MSWITAGHWRTEKGLRNGCIVLYDLIFRAVFFLHLPPLGELCCTEVGLCVPLLVTTPLISRVNNHALFAPLPWPCDQKHWCEGICVRLRKWYNAHVHLSFRSTTLSAPYSRCRLLHRLDVWSLRTKTLTAITFPPAVQFLGQRSRLQCFSWLGGLTVGIVTLDGIQYRVFQAVSPSLSFPCLSLLTGGCKWPVCVGVYVCIGGGGDH